MSTQDIQNLIVQTKSDQRSLISVAAKITGVEEGLPIFSSLLQMQPEDILHDLLETLEVQEEESDINDAQDQQLLPVILPEFMPIAKDVATDKLMGLINREKDLSYLGRRQFSEQQLPVELELDNKQDGLPDTTIIIPEKIYEAPPQNSIIAGSEELLKNNDNFFEAKPANKSDESDKVELLQQSQLPIIPMTREHVPEKAIQSDQDLASHIVVHSAVERIQADEAPAVTILVPVALLPEEISHNDENGVFNTKVLPDKIVESSKLQMVKVEISKDMPSVTPVNPPVFDRNMQKVDQFSSFSMTRYFAELLPEISESGAAIEIDQDKGLIVDFLSPNNAFIEKDDMLHFEAVQGKSVENRQAAPLPHKQVFFGIKHAAALGRSEINIKLFPANLGSVDVRIELVAEKTSAPEIRKIAFVAEKRETVELLKQYQEELRKSLEQVAEVKEEVSLQFDSKNEGQEQNSRDHGVNYFATKRQKNHDIFDLDGDYSGMQSDDTMVASAGNGEYLTDYSVNIRV